MKIEKFYFEKLYFLKIFHYCTIRRQKRNKYEFYIFNHFRGIFKFLAKTKHFIDAKHR